MTVSSQRRLWSWTSCVSWSATAVVTLVATCLQKLRIRLRHHCRAWQKLGKLMAETCCKTGARLEKTWKNNKQFMWQCEHREKVPRNRFGEFESEYVQMVWYWETILLMALKAGVRIMLKLCKSHFGKIFTLFACDYRAWIEHDLVYNAVFRWCWSTILCGQW